jgi:hypothetical protein
MAWTTPRTWVSGETVSATLMNEQVRDNENLLAAYVDTATGKPNWYQSNYMSGDITVNNSTTLVNLTGLAFTIGANEKWHFVAMLSLSSAVAAGIKWGLTYPAGAAGRFGSAYQASTQIGDAVISGTPVEYAWGATYLRRSVVSGLISNGATPGTVQLKMAQATADVSNTIVYTYSGIVAVQLI